MSEVFDAPPRRGNISRIADFAEVQCLARDDLNVAVHDISYAMSAPPSDDETLASPEEESWEEDAPEVWEALDDVDARRHHCGKRAFYPFRRTGRNSGQVTIAPPKNNGQRWHVLLYLFLLWLTRIGGSVKEQAAPREFFERLCCDVARNYWGRGIAGEMPPFTHFGATDNFRAKIENLAQKLGEGGFREDALKGGRTPKDDGVDIVVHRPFADGRVGQLIGLGQCKSGHGYGRRDLTELQPDAFFQNWFQGVSVSASKSVRLFFLSDRIANDELMFQYGNMAGILFDRCRIMEYAGEVDSDLKREIAEWILARLDEFEILDRLDKAAGINLRSAVE